MVAKITSPNSINQALNYNEQKVVQGVAECIHAQNFLKEAGQLNFYEKLNRLESQASLNDRATSKAVHISLNFAPGENLPKEDLIQIARLYMEKIGFGRQPYLVYQHMDAGHPHLHIVSTNIQKDGKRISLHNLGRNQSTAARKEIEKLFHLKKADEQKLEKVESLKPVDVLKVKYGKVDTRRGITNVLNHVLNQYSYSTLAELNAVLGLYNVQADRGREEGVIFRNRGLVYRVLDEKGTKIGVPIKASSIVGKPTLDYLEQKFAFNQEAKEAFRKNLKTTLDWVLLRPQKDLGAFTEALRKEKVALVVRQNTQGIIYGLTYIDQNTKSVFNGSDLGKEYSANAIMLKCGIVQDFNKQKQEVDKGLGISKQNDVSKSILDNVHLKEVLENLVKPEQQLSQLPGEWKKAKKKKRKSL